MLTSLGATLGRFTFRLDAYRGLSQIATQLRITSDVEPHPHTGTLADLPLSVRDLSLLVDVPGEPSEEARFGVQGTDPLEATRRPVSLEQEQVFS